MAATTRLLANYLRGTTLPRLKLGTAKVLGGNSPVRPPEVISLMSVDDIFALLTPNKKTKMRRKVP